MRILAISDEVVPTVWSLGVRRLEPDVVLSAGDLPFDYLEYLVSTLNVPLAFVPGNHDRDLSGITVSRVGMALRAGLPAREPGPAGALNVDGRCVDLGDLRVAGLGGSIRYRPGANQYTERQQARRARRLVRAARRLTRDGRGVDVLLTHTPPLGVGDGDDAAHRGFAVLHRVIRLLQPRYLLHGHIHPYGLATPEHVVGTTRVVNVVGRRVLDL
ncbi:MAG: metallophosphoesterase family protein [Frankia sp.]